jgi:outer membrane protein OmpA-like peptidoglycan-associated protein
MQLPVKRQRRLVRYRFGGSRLSSRVLLLPLLLSGCASFSFNTTEAVNLPENSEQTELGAIIDRRSEAIPSEMTPDSAMEATADVPTGGSVHRLQREYYHRDGVDQTATGGDVRLLEELRQRGIDVHESSRGMVINLPDVLFEPGRSELTRAARSTVQEIAAVLQRAPSRRLSVEGHTDSLGTIDYNYRLSDSRAREVAQLLEDSGIPGQRITTHAFGETTPLASNKTAQGRIRNRRVEIIVSPDTD